MILILSYTVLMFLVKTALALVINWMAFYPLEPFFYYKLLVALSISSSTIVRESCLLFSCSVSLFSYYYLFFAFMLACKANYEYCR